MRIPSPIRIWSWRSALCSLLLICLSPLAAAQQQKPPSSPPKPPAAKPAPAPAPAAAKVQHPLSNSPQAIGEDREDDDFVIRRDEWFYKQRAYPYDHIPAGLRLKAIEEMDRMMERQRAQDLANIADPSVSPLPTIWTNIGPAPLVIPSTPPNNSGRVTGIAIDPTNTSIMYLAAATGGVWKTMDGGTTWTALTDQQPSLAIGSIAIDPGSCSPAPCKTIYAGTGELNFSSDSYQGAGVLKSIDGGTTWTQLGAATFVGPFSTGIGGARIGSIAVDPTNSSILLAAVGIANSGPTAGIYRSTNAGVNWSIVATATGAAGTEVFFDPTNGNIAYAALGNIFGNAANGVYRSPDHGATWTPINGTGVNVIPSGAAVGRIEIAIAPSLPTTLYASIQDPVTFGHLLGFFKTTDSGANWTKLAATPDYCTAQCWYDMVVKVDPIDPMTVFAGGGATGNGTLIRTMDGGATWSNVSIGANGTILHVDHHALGFSTTGTLTLVVGNDGGAYSTTNVTSAPGSVNWTSLNANLSITQGYPGLAPHPFDESVAYLGTQDNGTNKFTGGLSWANINCGDGAWNALDPAIPSTLYLTCTSANPPFVRKSLQNGAVGTFAGAVTGINTSEKIEFIPPIVSDPNGGNPTPVYAGTNHLYQTMDGALTWASISPDLSGGAGDITTIAVQRTNANVVVVGTSDGHVQYSSNALAGPGNVTWCNLNFAGLPGRRITYVAVDKNNSSIVFATASGFTFGADAQGHVFKTTNATACAGAVWSDISGLGGGNPLPNIPVNTIVLDKDILTTYYVGTDIGVFQTTDAGANWSALNPLNGSGQPSLPKVPVVDLVLRRQSRVLWASTHGRGIWRLQLTNFIPAGPLFTSMTPATATAGGAGFTLTVDGASFTNSSVVQWNGSTTGLTGLVHVNANQMTVNVDPSLIAAGGAPQINVFDPTQNPTTSGSAIFTILNPAAVPATLDNNVATVGTPLTINITGTSFVQGMDAILFNSVGFVHNTTGVVSGSGTLLTVTLPGSTFPVATGAAFLTVSNPAPGGGSIPGAFAFTVNANAGPAAILSTLNVKFGNQNVGTTSATTNVTLTNGGGATLTWTSIALAGANPGEFTLGAPTTGTACVLGGGNLIAGASCGFGVAIKPTVAGGRAANVTLMDNAGDTPQIVSLSGTGVSVTPAVTFTPTNVAFGNQRVGTTSAATHVHVTNSGGATLNITSITLTGTDPTQFSLTSAADGGTAACPLGASALPAGNTCNVDTAFGPTTTGAKNANISVADDAAGSPQPVPLTGTGTAPAVTFAPTNVPFGNQRVGTTSAATHVHVTNSGGATLNIVSITLTGTDPTQFSLTSAADGGTPACPLGASALGAGNTCNVDTAFGPTTTGAKSASMSVADDATGSPQAVPLTGTGTAPGVMFAPTNVAFGNQPVGTSSAATHVHVTNNGTATLNITSITLTGTDPTQFSLTSIADGGTPACPLGASALGAGNTCNVDAKFGPTSTGAKNASMSVADDATGSPQAVPLSGTGTASGVMFNPSNVNFGNQRVGTTSAATHVHITNSGTATLNITSITLTGTDVTQFSLTSAADGGTAACPLGASALGMGNTCNVDTAFGPTTTGAKNANISVADDATGSPQTVPLSGTGTAPGVMFAPTNVAFGNQRVGTTSAATHVHVTNSGGATLNITSITLTGTDPTQFSLTSAADGGTAACPLGASALPAGNTCNVDTAFGPTTTGAKSASMSVADDATGSPQPVPLTGTGTAPAVTFAPANVAFGNQRVGTTSAATHVHVTNSGTATLNIVSITLTGTDPTQFSLTSAADGGTPACPLGASALGAGNTCNVDAAFGPTTTGAKSASMSVADDATGSPQPVPLTGTGTAPAVTFAPTNVPFGNQRVGTTSAATHVHVTNSGTATLNITSITLTGTDPTQFSLTSIADGGTPACPLGASALGAGNTCNVDAKFGPTTTGAKSASMSVADDATGSPQPVPLTGTGTAPAIAFLPTNVNFGNVVVGTSSAATHVHVTNGGTATLNITSITLTGTDVTQFSLTSAADGGTPACSLGASALGAGNTCNVDAKFGPTTTGVKNASMSVADDATGSPQAVALTGTGTTSTVVFNPANVSFGNQRVGTTSAATHVHVMNGGLATLNITSITLTGTDPTQFSLTSAADGGTAACPLGASALAPNSTCNVDAAFGPTSAGAKSASMTVTDDAGGVAGSMQSVPLTGTGIAPIAGPPTNLVFGNQIIGTTSAAQTVTLSNTGTDVLNLATVVLSDTVNYTIAAGTTCTNGSMVNAGANCIVNVTFNPPTVGSKPATLTFTDDSNGVAGSQQVSNLSGTGVTPPTAMLSTNALAFGNQRVGTTSVAQSVTVTNNGGAPLSIATVTYSGDYTTSSGTTCTNGSMVNPGQNCLVNVTFTPTVTGLRNGNVVLTDNAGGVAGSQQMITLTGTGTQSVSNLSTNNLAFGNQRVNTTSAAMTVTITNTGTATLNFSAITVGGTQAGDFTVAAGTTCVVGTPVPVAGNCAVNMTFKPGAAGVRAGTLTFTHDASTSPQLVTLGGTGTTSVGAANPTNVAFPVTAVGTTSAALPSPAGTLTNTGTASLNINAVGGVTFTGANPGDFAVAAGSTCINGAVVLPTANCTWSVTFTPSAVGTRNATLTFTSDAANSPQMVTLTGSTPPAVSFNPNTGIAFGNQGVGSTSTAMNVTLTNSGGSNLTFNSITITGANAADFALASGTTCSTATPVAAGANCIVSATVKPGAVGARAGSVSIADNAPGSPQAIALAANGVDFTVAGPAGAAGTVTVNAGQPAVYVMTVTPVAGGGGFPNPVTFTASGLPAATTATFVPPAVTPNNAAVMSTLTITTTARMAVPPRGPASPPRPFVLLWIGTAMLALMSLALGRKAFRTRRFAMYLPLAVLLLAAAGIMGCANAAHPGTPMGMTQVTITATSGGVAHNTQVTLIVN